VIDIDCRYLEYLAEYMTTRPTDVLDMVFDQYNEDIRLVEHTGDAWVVLKYSPYKERPDFSLQLKQFGVSNEPRE
jgi:hypothetical protein